MSGERMAALLESVLTGMNVRFYGDLPFGGKTDVEVLAERLIAAGVSLAARPEAPAVWHGDHGMETGGNVTEPAALRCRHCGGDL